MSELHCCPVCTGAGFVPYSLYYGADQGTSSPLSATCRSCSGLGFVRVDLYPTLEATNAKLRKALRELMNARGSSGKKVHAAWENARRALESDEQGRET